MKSKLQFKEEIKLDGNITVEARTKDELEYMKQTLQKGIQIALEGWNSFHMIKGKEQTRRTRSDFQLILKKGVNQCQDLKKRKKK